MNSIKNSMNSIKCIACPIERYNSDIKRETEERNELAEVLVSRLLSHRTLFSLLHRSNEIV